MPKVAVWMVTYNHEKYIRQAIESVMMQKTSFDYKLYIGEDCSTDSTRDICLALSRQYPGKIELHFNEKNIGSTNNGLRTYRICFETGCDYVALIEGDDYWTDEHKLQKQVDFLEANKNIVCHTHNASIIDDNGYVGTYNSGTKETLTRDDIVANLSIPTASVMFRNCLDPIPEYFANLPYDIVLYFALSGHGDFYRSDENMSAYRLHGSGFWTGQSTIKQLNENIRIKEYFINKMPLTAVQKKKVKQHVVDIRLNRLRYYANNSFFSRNYFADMFYLVSSKLASFRLPMKYFLVCSLPESVTNIFKKG